MAASTSGQPNLMWLVFALLVVCFWGCYGVAMHAAGIHMSGEGGDPFARYKAYIFVGVAYVVVAILAPVVLMAAQGASWGFPSKGIMFALFAGTLGAFGAFFVLSAMGAVSKRPWMIPVVMCVIFAGAPIVNAIVALIVHPPHDGWGSIKPQFWIGIFVAALGATMVTYYKPGPKPKQKVETPAQVEPSTPSAPSGENSTPTE